MQYAEFGRTLEHSVPYLVHAHAHWTNYQVEY